MTIKIVAKDLPSSQTLDVIRICNKVILSGNYGSYNSDNGKFTIVFHLKELSPEITQIFSSLEEYVIEFSCSPTEVEITETFSAIENLDANFEEQPNNEAGSQSNDESVVATESKVEIVNADPDESKAATSLEQIESKVATITNAKEAVFEMFKDVEGTKNAEEISNEVIKHLNLESNFYKKSLDNISKIIVAFVKAPVKPNNFAKLQKLLDFKVWATTITKLNSITRESFKQYNISITFLECLEYVCEKVGEEHEESNDTEEVILSPPEKPPDKQIKTPKDLIEFITSLDPEFSIAERIKKLVDFMGLQDFEKYNQLTVEKCFVSIITNKKTNLEELFSLDQSLKQYSTAHGATKVLIRFIGNFFMTEVNEDFVIEFFKDLINNFSGSFAVKHNIPQKSFSFKKSNFNEEKEEIKQEPGELRCFPKNPEFDTFIRKEVRYKKLSRLQKVTKILKYMGINKLPKDTSKTVLKICCNSNVLYYRFPGYVENIPANEIKIVEEFVNDFAKKLKSDAKYIRLQNFFTSLRLLL